MRLSHSPRAMGAPLPRSDQSPALSNRPRPHGRQKPRPHRVAPPPSAAPGVTRRSGRGRGGQGRCHRGLGDRDNAGGGGGQGHFGGGQGYPRGCRDDVPGALGMGTPQDRCPRGGGDRWPSGQGHPRGGWGQGQPPHLPRPQFPPCFSRPEEPCQGSAAYSSPSIPTPLVSHPRR